MSDYDKIAQAIHFINGHPDQPTLEQVAAAINLSPSHCQRLFSRYAGVSPKQFLQYLTVGHAKHLLKQSYSVLDASIDAGLSSPGRLHDHFITLEAVTPGQYRSGGDGLLLHHGQAETPFGITQVAFNNRGICKLAFQSASFEEELKAEWPEAQLQQDDRGAAELLDGIFNRGSAAPLRLLVKGTNFQLKVWEALLKVPEGQVSTYGEIAQLIDKPSAVRAVGTAVGANPIAYLIPCHRVIRASGALGGYRWGLERKQAMLAMESF